MTILLIVGPKCDCLCICFQRCWCQRLWTIDLAFCFVSYAKEDSRTLTYPVLLGAQISVIFKLFSLLMTPSMILLAVHSYFWPFFQQQSHTKKLKYLVAGVDIFRWIYPHVSIAFKYIYLSVKITRHVITSLPMSANCMFLQGTWESRDWAGCLTVVLDLGLGILRYWSNLLFFLSKSSWRLWYFCPVGHDQILFLT